VPVLSQGTETCPTPHARARTRIHCYGVPFPKKHEIFKFHWAEIEVFGQILDERHSYFAIVTSVLNEFLPLEGARKRHYPDT